MIISIQTLKDWFTDTNIPSQDNFYDFLDSYWHKGTLIPVDTFTELQDKLDVKADTSVLDTYHTKADIGDVAGADFCEYLKDNLEELAIAIPSIFSREFRSEFE